MKKLKLILAIAFIGLLVGIIVFLNLPAKDQAALIPHFDVPEEFVAVRDYTSEERKEIGIYRYTTSDTESYAVGMNQYDKPVFKDPHKAITALYADYHDTIEYMCGTASNLVVGLQNPTSINFRTEADDPLLRDQIKFVVEFILIFSNSFHK